MSEDRSAIEKLRGIANGELAAIEDVVALAAVAIVEAINDLPANMQRQADLAEERRRESEDHRIDAQNMAEWRRRHQYDPTY